jgi:hypothetical protein
MNNRFTRSLHIYYALCMLFVGGALTYGLYFFWHQGPTNVENINSVFEANLLVADLKKKNDGAKLREFVVNDRIRDAARLIEQLDRDVQKLNQASHVESYLIMRTDLREVRDGLTALLAFPELSTVMLVFSNKINNFEGYVSTNNWATLTRTARRVQSRVTPERIRSSDFFSSRRINEMTRSFEQDFELMRNVTTNSVLSNENKNAILTHLSTFDPELDMMRNYASGLESFKRKLGKFENSYGAWLAQVEPAIALRRIDFEKNSQAVLFSFLGLIAFVLFAFVGGFIVSSYTARSTKRTIEQLIVTTVRDALIPLESKLTFEPSKEFDHELNKYREYVHKRMSFGTIFQEAMPFSSILLDSNLNVVWANSLFYEHWKMSQNQVDDGSTTWDFLQQFTNLGEDDPVLQALRYNVAGIYQIQVRRTTDAPTVPFEMYVSPVEYAGQKRIMIIFYPLSSVEQTLSDQTKSLVGPVIRSLDALAEGEWNSEFQHKIEKDFDIAGIKHVFDRFVAYFSKVTDQKDDLLREVEELVNSLSQQKQLMGRIQDELNQQKKINQTTVREFQRVKEDIIAIVELRGRIEEHYQSTATCSKALMKDELELLTKAKDVNQLLHENVQAFDTVCKVRDEFKSLKLQVDNYRTTISQLLDQALLFVRTSIEDSSKVDQSLGQIKVEMRNFDKLLQTFSKVATQLDVGLSKVSMILDRNESPDLTAVEKKFSISRESIENDMFDVSRLIAEGDGLDQRMIDSLKDMYAQFKLSLKKIDELEDLVLSGSKRKVESLGPVYEEVS